jgi:hypothetical protein
MDREKQNNSVQKNKGPQADQETLHSTDPQENMEGPVSSSMKETGEAFDTDEDKRNADEKRDRRL